MALPPPLDLLPPAPLAPWVQVHVPSKIVQLYPAAHPTSRQVPTWQVPSGAQVSLAPVQSAGLTQTGVGAMHTPVASSQPYPGAQSQRLWHRLSLG